MRFREISPKARIRCRNEEEAKGLLRHLKEKGYKWEYGKELDDWNTCCFQLFGSGTIYSLDAHTPKRVQVADAGLHGTGYVECADLILPDYSAVDIVRFIIENRRASLLDGSIPAEAVVRFIMDQLDAGEDAERQLAEETLRQMVPETDGAECALGA